MSRTTTDGKVLSSDDGMMCVFREIKQDIGGVCCIVGRFAVGEQQLEDLAES